MRKTLIRYSLIFLITAGLVGLDIVTKIIFEGKNITLIYNFLLIQSEHNYGAALGIFSGHTIWLIIISVIFIVAFLVFDYFFKSKSKLYFISFVLILAGALGNLIDRIFLGYVRDFIHVNISIMPYYFNLADIFLTFGVIFLLISVLFVKDNNQNQTNAKISQKEEMKKNGEVKNENNLAQKSENN